MEKNTSREQVVRMNVTKGSDWLDADAAAPVVAVIGGSQTDVELLESMASEQGFRLFSAEEGAVSGTEGVPPDVVILDTDESAVPARVESRLDRVRSRCDAPVLCLVPHSGGLSHEAIGHLSADDYLFKPMRSVDLWSRVRVLLRRRLAPRADPLVERRRGGRRQEDRVDRPASKFDGRCMIDEANKAVVLEGRELHLTRKEYDLFCLLLQNAGRILSPREIIRQVWRDARRASAADVHQYMHLLRRKVEPELSRPRWIVTVRGFGYKLVIPKAN